MSRIGQFTAAVIVIMIITALAGCASKDKDVEILRLQQASADKDRQISAMQSQPPVYQSPPMVLTAIRTAPLSDSIRSPTNPAAAGASLSPVQVSNAGAPSLSQMQVLIEKHIRANPAMIPAVVTTNGSIEFIKVVDIKKTDSTLYPYDVYAQVRLLCPPRPSLGENASSECTEYPVYQVNAAASEIGSETFAR